MKKQWWLVIILALAFFLRFYRVGELPAQLNRDEAGVAYNAYLLMETGQDEWQRRWPLALESFGDYKLPGYSVSLIPFFKVLGLHDWVARLPSVLAGTVIVWLIYEISRRFPLPDRGALLAAFIAATSPILVFYSRMAFEANLALAFFLGMILMLLKLKDHPKWWQYLLLVLLSLVAVLTYNTPLLLLPFLMLFALTILGWKNRSRLLLVEGILGTVLVIGLVLLSQVAAQKSGITIFTDETVWNNWVQFRTSLSGPWQHLIGSRPAYYLWLMAEHLVATFSPRFLVTTGGTHPWHSLPTTGHIMALVYGFGLVGIGVKLMVIWFNKHRLAAVKLPLAWLGLLLAATLPSIITVDSPHATRSLLFFVLFQIFAVSGMGWLIENFFKQKYLTAWLLIIGLLIGEAGLHAYQLFGLYPQTQQVFQPGLEQTLASLENKYPDANIAVVDPAGYYYILWAWYLKLPPADYFHTVIRQQPDQIGFRYGQQLTHYHFIAATQDRAENESVLVQWSGENWQIEDNL